MTLFDRSTHAHEPALPAWRVAFLLVLGTRANVSEAAAAAGITRQRAYQLRQSTPAFAADWDAALEAACDQLEQEAWRRALEGGRQYKFNLKTGAPLLFPAGSPQAGQPYYETVYSDALLTLLLKAHRPDKYKERSSVDVTATVAPAPAYDLGKLSPADLLTLREMKRKLLAGGGEEVAGGS